ncbi:alpha/beta fold hydrolase [Feifania hominis]|uniref:Alpha/beta hydrolase n=1 Tax=Feifania hominis TaxID=2763660 RepID=A0A926DE55_9FIRM|nr:alpha/beta hydrolase [Feifania hominis]MBC8536551.1 alpha/beta hydrolase [Feifania hominis]
MFCEIDQIKLHYETEGEGPDVLILHGWGTNIRVMASVIAMLRDHFRVTAIDFPGFGESAEPPVAWGVPEYAALTKKFIEAQGLVRPILLGHSFGGRVILYMTGALGVEADKIVLTDSAGVKPKRKLKGRLKVMAFKTMKWVLLALPFAREKNRARVEAARKKFGSADYNSASGVMRETLIRVVNQDLTEYMPAIKAPTLLMWGEDDRDTPLADAKLMERLIPDAGLVTFKGAGHYSFLDKPGEFRVVLNTFLRGQRS